MLKHLVKKSAKKRDDGETVLNLFPVILTSVIMFALVMLFSSWIRNVDTKDNVDQVCRKYMLKMETQGYLTTDMQKNLKNELKAAGVVDGTIKFTTTKNGKTYKTTTTEQEYGNQIYLALEFDIKANTPRLKNTDEIQKDTTSKHNFMEVVSGTNGKIHYSVLRGTTSKKNGK